MYIYMHWNFDSMYINIFCILHTDDIDIYFLLFVIQYSGHFFSHDQFATHCIIMHLLVIIIPVLMNKI